MKKQVGNNPWRRVGQVVFKQEYLNPTGSVKDWGISHQVVWLAKQGVKEAVISSSGNAAISAAYYCKQARIKLKVFLSPKINSVKLARLMDFDGELEFDVRPVSAAFRFAKKRGVYNLRPSVDPEGTVGYRSLGAELARFDLGAIFFPVSSGTTLVGVMEGWGRIKKELPQVHIVQTTAVHPLAQGFDENFESTKSSLADALVARSVPRRGQVLKMVKETDGWGWVIDDEQILKAGEWLSSRGLECSCEGALTLAGIWKAQEAGWKWKKDVGCLLTGKSYLSDGGKR